MSSVIKMIMTSAAVCALLVGCSSKSDSGGGAGKTSASQKSTATSSRAPISSATDRWQAGVYGNPDDYYSLCAAPRTGYDPITDVRYPDQKGRLLDEQLFIRSLIHDTYLWYREVVDRNPAGFATAPDYFAVLKTNAVTASGRLKDEYHFTMPTAVSNQQSAGVAVASHGLTYAVMASDALGLNIQVRHVVEGSPAWQAGIMRGDRLLQVGPIALNAILSDAEIDYLVAALFEPQVNVRLSLDIQRVDGSRYSVDVFGARVAPAVVDSIKVFDRGDKTLGYFTFHRFTAPAEAALRDVFNDFVDAGVNELVLDLRYNGGGYIPIAAQLAYMIAGPDSTRDKVFVKTQFNDKHPVTDPFTNRPVDTFGFLSTTTEYFGNSLSHLPSLNLSEVTVITSEETCSASELVINGLRGAGIKVTQIGSTTCGKPYGFYEVENCGTSYFFVQMQNVNHNNFGDYADGFSPAARDDGETQVQGCWVEDDLTYPLGDSREQSLAAALRILGGETCTAPTANGETRAPFAKTAAEQDSPIVLRLREAQRSPLDRALLVAPSTR